MKLFLPLLAILAYQAVAAQTPIPAPDSKLIRIFVESEISAEGSDLAGKRQSVEDLKTSMGSKKMKKSLVVVALARESDVIVEVVERTVITPKFVMGLGPRPGESGLMSGPTRTPLLRVEVGSGGERLRFANKNKVFESATGWQLAADDVVDQIEKWVSSHRTEILKRRGPG